ncbi:helix-turn-helix domain-containing protein [Lacticaseibacillus zhaodongensis]|uniref:helix-turn-helix domain-containing protein n=1 Tax=Lacticaseibacillus zhaodongensis TaxID=2668065 RepID=UPI0012D35B1A|nr:RodZ domain-containing protein [Lacticaseibacillus zhaodongensis]
MDEIGQKLRDARLEKGYTIDDLQQITKIQKRYLIAIEEGNFDALPGDFYVRAFIKQYASVVGINTDELMEEYQQDIPTVKPVVPTDEEEAGNGETKQTRVTPAVEQARKNRFRHYLPQIGIAIFVIILLVVVYTLTITQQRKDSKPSIPVDSSSVSVEKSNKKTKSSASKTQSSSKKASSSSSSTKAKKSSKKSSKSKGLRVSKPTDVAANSQTFTVKNLPSTGNKIQISTTTAAAWTSVTIDGTTSWQGTLNAGAKQSVTIPTGAKTVVVKSGNATVSAFKINNKKVDLGDSTSLVRTLTFTIE